MKFTHVLAPLALAVVAGPTIAQDVGTRLPDEIELEDFANLPVKGYDELLGRAVLIEFFAYW